MTVREKLEYQKKIRLALADIPDAPIRVKMNLLKSLRQWFQKLKVKTEAPEPEKQLMTQADINIRRKRREYVDVGEKIGGAKKDLWSTKSDRGLDVSDYENMDSGAAHKLVTKTNVFKGVLDEFIDENGMDAQSAFVFNKVMGSIQTKPNDSDQDRKNYVIACDKLKEYFRGATNIDEFYEVYKQIRMEVRGYHLTADELPYKEFMDKWRKEYFDAVDKLTKENEKGGMTYYSASGDARRKAMEKYKNDPKYIEAKKILDDAYDREVNDPNSVANQYQSLGKRFNNLILGRSNAFNKNFEASQYLEKDDFSWREKKKRSADSKKNKEKWKRIVPESVERSGGRNFDFKPDDILNEFKIRGLEYGNYVDEESAKHHTQMMGLGFVDMADALDIPFEQISYGGKLGMAIGARGSGNALAHYEPAKKVINMTKLKGGGSLAHEWGHYLDNMITNVLTDGENSFSFMTQSDVDGIAASSKKTGAKEIASIYKRILKNMKSGDKGRKSSSVSADDGTRTYRWPFYGEPDEIQDAQALMDRVAGQTKRRGNKRVPAFKDAVLQRAADYIEHKTGQTVYWGEGKSQFQIDSENAGTGKKSKYWTSDVEMFARMFEAVIQNKLTKKGIKNTYLVTDVKRIQGPYPRGEELEYLETEVDNLFAVLKRNNLLEQFSKY